MNIFTLMQRNTWGAEGSWGAYGDLRAEVGQQREVGELSCRAEVDGGGGSGVLIWRAEGSSSEVVSPRRVPAVPQCSAT